MFAIVITSINNPTAAVHKYVQLSQTHKLLVVGDEKTPEWPSSEGWRMITLQEQFRLKNLRSIEFLPTNHYSRKMVGYLLAIGEGVDGIIDTDDDNEPIEGYGFPQSQGLFEATAPNQGWVNIFKYFTDKEVWPRGLPLRNIRTTPGPLGAKNEYRVGIFQGLADGDTDLDAIYRLTRDNPSISFQKRDPLVLEEGTLTPFNSQNTLFFPPVFPLLYLPTTVTFRFTDILRSVVAQPILWAAGLRLGFTKSTVYQDRNVHDLLSDFKSEVPMYLSIEKAAELAISATSNTESIETNLMNIYKSLAAHGIVMPEETKILECWLADLRTLGHESSAHL